MDVCPIIRMEEAILGDLAAFQAAVPASECNADARVSLCFDVAAGVAALHDAGVVHSNLDITHVLIFPGRGKDQFRAKICGFSNTVMIADGSQAVGELNGRRGTGTLWTAPEIKEACVQLDDVARVDVYSLGLVMWQILVHSDPFSVFDLPLEEKARHAEMDTILRLPYLFRFIPFFVEDVVGNQVNEKLFLLMARIFERSFRLNPRSRDLDDVLDSLGEASGRKLNRGAAIVRPQGSDRVNTPVTTGVMPENVVVGVPVTNSIQTPILSD